MGTCGENALLPRVAILRAVLLAELAPTVAVAPKRPLRLTERRRIVVKMVAKAPTILRGNLAQLQRI